ncbi:hypothetical protein G9A89_022164 [Geosiphon pyriformis]|nr:hypothetical protein G9A89_022164 [Geosiphon pyriformis]
MYTDAKVDGHSIKLILNINRTASTRIITANGTTKTPIGEIDDFSIEVNDIIVPIKVLIIKATQYQAFVLATCGHFNPITTPSTPLIKFEKKKVKPIWKAYQVSWANIDHNKLPPILAWDNNDNGKKKQREKPIWEATIDTWTNNNQKRKEQGKREENIPEETTTTEKITSDWKREYSREPIKEPPYISLKCKDCEKKLSAIGNDIATQKDKESRTTNYVLLAANNYLTKECGTTFLVKEECATFCANTQSLSATG